MAKIKMRLIGGAGGTRFVGPFSTQRNIELETKVKLGRVGLFTTHMAHNLTHMDSDAPRRKTFGLFGPKNGWGSPRDILPTQDEMVARAGVWAEKKHKQLLEASGTRYEVLVRGSTRMKSAGKFGKFGKAMRRANAKCGVVHDHYEGRDTPSASYHARYGPKDSPPETSNGDQDTDGTWEVSA